MFVCDSKKRRLAEAERDKNDHGKGKEKESISRLQRNNQPVRFSEKPEDWPKPFRSGH